MNRGAIAGIIRVSMPSAFRVLVPLVFSLCACDARSPAPAEPQPPTPAAPTTPASTPATPPSPATEAPQHNPREARINLSKIFDAAAANFNEDRDVKGQAKHFCANDGRARGESGFVPPLTVKCHAAPGGVCTPSATPSDAPGSYDAKLWTEHPVWRSLGFLVKEPHAFHYNFIWENSTTGFGKCVFTIQAVADLDGDDVWSTFERKGGGSEEGIDGSAGLYIHQELE